ncbi:MAG: hypothetical protein M0015_15985 [Betaproteobacteria bacterium]|nr:hypothetical protein [Betaproteobacteria bacterium]
MSSPSTTRSAAVPEAATSLHAAEAAPSTQPGVVVALAELAPEWFRMLEWLGLTIAIHVLATWTGSTLLEVGKWISYLMLFTWMSYKIDRALQWLFSRSARAEQAGAEPMHPVIAVGLGATLIPMLYIFVQYVAIVLIARLGS